MAAQVTLALWRATAAKRGGMFSMFSRPKLELRAFIAKLNLYIADFDGCAFGMTNSRGEPLLKKWRVATDCGRLAKALSSQRCKHGAGCRHGAGQARRAGLGCWVLGALEALVARTCEINIRKGLAILNVDKTS